MFPLSTSKHREATAMITTTPVLTPYPSHVRRRTFHMHITKATDTLFYCHGSVSYFFLCFLKFSHGPTRSASERFPACQCHVRIRRLCQVGEDNTKRRRAIHHGLEWQQCFRQIIMDLLSMQLFSSFEPERTTLFP